MSKKFKVIGLAIVLLVILAGCAGYFDGYGYSDYPYNYAGYGYYGYPYYDYGYYPYGYYGGGRGIRCPSCGAPHLGTGGEGSQGGRGDGHRERGR